MANTVHVDIVSAEHEIYSGEATVLFAPAVMGEVGITPGHTALLTRLAPGVVRVQTADDDAEQTFYVSGGILEVQPTVVTVLSDTAMRAEDLDEQAVLKARDAAERAFHDHDARIDYARAQAQLAETAAQLRALQRLRKLSGRS